MARRSRRSYRRSYRRSRRGTGHVTHLLPAIMWGSAAAIPFLLGSPTTQSAINQAGTDLSAGNYQGLPGDILYSTVQSTAANAPLIAGLILGGFGVRWLGKHMGSMKITKKLALA